MKLINFLLICLLAFPFELIAQPGALDPGFASGGILVSSQGSTSYTNIGLQPSGKIIVACDLVNAGYEIFRLNLNGSTDNTFGTNGKLSLSFNIDDMTIQPDGKIIIISLDKIFRFNENGSPDNTFGENGVAVIQVSGVTLRFSAVAIDNNGKIVVTGHAAFGSTTTLSMARVNSDGTLDTGFNGGGVRTVLFGDGIMYEGTTLTIDNNNNLVIGVQKGLQGATIHEGFVTRYLQNGSLDVSFGSGGIVLVSRPPYSMQFNKTNNTIVYASDKIQTLNLNGGAGPMLLQGSLSAVAVPTTFISRIGIQPDGKIIATGETELVLNDYSKIWMRRFETNGVQDIGRDGVITDLLLGAGPLGITYANKRIYASGILLVPQGGGFQKFGVVIAYDGTDYLLRCVSNRNVSVDPGKCSAVVNEIDPVFTPSSLGNVDYKVDHNGTIETGSVATLSGRTFNLGTTHVTYTYEDITKQTCSFDVTVYDGDPPVAHCKNVTVQLDATGNGTLTAAQVNNGSTDGCGIKSMTINKTSFNCSDPSSNTVTLTVTDNNDNQSTCTATVTVEDNVPPVAKCKNKTVYLDAAGNASITAAQIDDGSTDACGIKSLSLDKTIFNCSNKGSNTVTLTVTDNHDNTATCTATVTVLDTIPPVISSVVPTPSAIWPSDRKMHNVSVATTSSDNCIVHSCRITGVAIKAGEFAGDNIGPDWEITSANTVNLRAEIPKKGVKRIYTVTVTCIDASNNSSTSTTDVIVAHNITSPISGATVRISSTVNLSGEFWDVPGKKHTAKWLIDDKTINVSVKEPSGINSGAVTGSYKFTAAGVYKLQMNITDQNGITTYANTSENLNAIIVVYDPNGGYTYGGGYYTSPAGALISNPSFTGDASYGFTVNYYKNATLPKGETQFEFKVGDFEFNALNFEYLVISNSMSQFKGTGKITGGQSGVGFTMTVTDGQLDGSGIDKIRMKIYNRSNGAIIYDNQPGASDAALPTQAVGANSTIVISGTNSSLTQSNTTQKAEMEVTAPEVSSKLNVIAYPNPSATNFSISVKENPGKERITMQVIDMYGKIIETRNVNANSPIRFGDRYNPGTYFVRIIQGKEHKEIKLVKLSD